MGGKEYPSMERLILPENKESLVQKNKAFIFHSILAYFENVKIAFPFLEITKFPFSKDTLESPSNN